MYTSVIDFMPSHIFLLFIPLQKSSILGFKDIIYPNAIHKYLLKQIRTPAANLCLNYFIILYSQM